MKPPILLTLTAAIAAATISAAAPAPKPPNIILFLVDDMGWRDVGFMGSRYYQTPNIDALASRGLRFQQGYAACAVCSPTRASLMTGQHPARLHLTDWIPGEGNKPTGHLTIPAWQQSLPTNAPTLAETLKKAGYATAIAGKWHLGNGATRPEKRGFDVTLGVNHAGQPAAYFFPYGKDAKNPSQVTFAGDRTGDGPRKDEYLTDRLTAESQAFIESHHAARPEQPFFLYLAHYAVHAPIQAKPAMTDAYKARQPDGGQNNPAYAAMVDSVDQSMGNLLATLDKLKLRDNTVIVFTSDNGGAVHFPATSNAPLRKGKGYAYEGGTRVPFLIVWPGHIPAGDNNTPVVSTDLYPTLLAVAGIRPAHPPDGLDLSPLWNPARDELMPIDTRDALFWHYPHYWNTSPQSLKNGSAVTPYSSVRLGEWKLIHFYEDDHQELYHLKADPYERKDLAKENPDQVTKLRARLDAWLKATHAQLPTAKAP